MGAGAAGPGPSASGSSGARPPIDVDLFGDASPAAAGPLALRALYRRQLLPAMFQ